MFNILVREASAVSFSEPGAKKCSKGKSCSATCIYKGDECLVDLDPSVAEAMTKLVGYVKNYVSRGGSEDIAEKAVERISTGGSSNTIAKKVSGALDALQQKYPDAKEREEKISQVFDLVLPGIAKKGDTGEKQSYDEDQINFLMKNKNIESYEKIYRDVQSGKLKSPDEINAALRPLAQSRRVNNISDEQVDLAMAILPKDLVSGLSKQGEPGEWGKWGARQNTLDAPKDGHTSVNKSPSERARLIVKIGLEEGMRDMYTGRRIGFGDIDLEHTIPFGVAKAGAETGSNFGLTTRLNNRSKGDISPEDWRQKVLKQYPTENGVLTEESRKKLRAQQDEAETYNRNKARVSSGTTADTVAGIFKGIDESKDSPKTKAKLKNKAMQSLAGYTETYMKGYRANRAGARRRVYVFKDSDLGTQVLNKAAEKIDKYSKAGDQAKVDNILKSLQSAAGRINDALGEKYGAERLDNQATEAASIADRVRKEILDEIGAI